MTSTLRIGLHGASGRMGRAVIREIQSNPSFVLAGAFVSSASTALGSKVEGTEIEYSRVTGTALRGCDAVISFSAPVGVAEIVRECEGASMPLLVATTGLEDETMRALRDAGGSIPILYAPNTSRGVAIMRALCEVARRNLGPEFEVEILEIHHRAKRDQPSGTARMLANAIASVGGGGEVALGRTPEAPREDNQEIGVASLRGGSVAGDHTVYFLGPDERIEVTHRAQDRRIFASGALWFAAQLRARPQGVYQVSDFISIY